MRLKNFKKPQKEPTREQIRADNRKKRTFKKSGLDKDDIMQEKRKRKPIQRLNL